MSKNKKTEDDVILPGAEKKEEEQPKVEEAPKNVEPPKEDVKVVEEPKPEEVKVEEKKEEADEKVEKVERVRDKRPVERLKVIQSRNIADVEKAYSEWYDEFAKSDAGHITERHVVEGGNGLIVLAIFYIQYVSAK